MGKEVREDSWACVLTGCTVNEKGKVGAGKGWKIQSSALDLLSSLFLGEVRVEMLSRPVHLEFRSKDTAGNGVISQWMMLKPWSGEDSPGRERRWRGESDTRIEPKRRGEGILGGT